MELIDGLVAAAEKIGAMKEWGVIAFLLLLNLWQMLTARKDRNQTRKEEIEKDAKIDDLLNYRHEQFKEVFTKAVNVLAENKGVINELTGQIEDLEKQVDTMDRRCDERQQTRKSSERRRN